MMQILGGGHPRSPCDMSPLLHLRSRSWLLLPEGAFAVAPGRPPTRRATTTGEPCDRGAERRYTVWVEASHLSNSGSLG